MRAAVALFCAACGGDPPPPEDHYVDLDALLSVWQQNLDMLDAATPGQTASPDPLEPSPARDSALLATLTWRLVEQAARLRTEALLAPTWGPKGSVAFHADLDGDRTVGPSEPLVASIRYDVGNQRAIAVDEEHPSLVRDLSVPTPLGRASAYTYGRMTQTQRAAGWSDHEDERRVLQPPGYHGALPAR